MGTLTIALRGASSEAPENTLPAFKAAQEYEAEMIALELQSSKDRIPMVIADAKLERTTNGSGRVSQLEAKELQALDAGSWFDPKFKTAKVPKLDQAVKDIEKNNSSTKLMIHMPEIEANSELLHNIAKVLQNRANPGEDVLVFTESLSLQNTRELLPQFGYGLRLDAKAKGFLYIQKATKLNIGVICPHREQVDAKLVREAHEKNLKVLVQFADEEEHLQELVELRVDGVVTSHPERLKRIVAETIV